MNASQLLITAEKQSSDVSKLIMVFVTWWLHLLKMYYLIGFLFNNNDTISLNCDEQKE